MTFNSRKDFWSWFTIISICLFLTGSVGYGWMSTDFTTSEQYLTIPLLALVVFLLWIFFGTKYTLTSTEFIYKSGPIKGKINLDRIKEVEVGKTLWAGFKPATAMKGLILKYDLYNEIYISPKTNEAFISKLMELNSNILIKHER